VLIFCGEAPERGKLRDAVRPGARSVFAVSNSSDIQLLYRCIVSTEDELE